LAQSLRADWTTVKSLQTCGTAVVPKPAPPAPFVVQLKLDDAELAKRLPAGSTGGAAISSGTSSRRMSSAVCCCGRSRS
jgi:hypothetical protein